MLVVCSRRRVSANNPALPLRRSKRRQRAALQTASRCKVCLFPTGSSAAAVLRQRLMQAELAVTTMGPRVPVAKAV